MRILSKISAQICIEICTYVFNFKGIQNQQKKHVHIDDRYSDITIMVPYF
jgi:hypothetical protein